MCCDQTRIFIFGALGYFKSGAFLEGSRRLMSHKLALHVFVSFTEQVVPIHKRIAVLLNSLNIRNKSSHNETNEKRKGEVI